MVGIINKKRRLVNLLFCVEFIEKRYRGLRCSCRKEPYVKEFARFWIYGSVQPAPLVINLNPCFVDCDVIRRRIAGWL